MILVSRNIRYIYGYSRGFLGEGRQTTVCCRRAAYRPIPVPMYRRKVFSFSVLHGDVDGFPLRHSQRPINVIYSSTPAGVHVERTREMSDVR